MNSDLVLAFRGLSDESDEDAVATPDDKEDLDELGFETDDDDAELEDDADDVIGGDEV